MMDSIIKIKDYKVGLHNKIDLYDCFFGIIVIACVMTHDYKISCVVALLAMAGYMINLLINSTIIYLKYLHFIFAVTATIVGCAVIEFSDFFLDELSTQASYVGALPMLIFSWWVFLVTIKYHDKWMVKRQEKKQCVGVSKEVILTDYFDPNKKYRSVIALIGAGIGGILIIYSFMSVYSNPAFMLGLDRFQYSEEFDYGFAYNQATRFIGFLIIPVIVLAINRKSKICWGILGVYCLYAFWTGNKFGIFFSLLCSFSMILSQKIDLTNKKNLKAIIVMIISIGLLVGVAVFGVSFTKDDNSLDYLFQRTAQQGQLWWKTYNDSNTIHFSEIGDELKSITNGEGDISENIGLKYGIYKIMYYTAPHTQIDTKLRSGSRYTEAGFAAAYYYLGIIGCVLFAVIGAIMTSLFVNSFLFHLRYNQWIRAFIHFRLYGFTLVMMSMFIFFPFFGKVTLLCYIVLLICKNKIFRIGKMQV